MRRFSLFLGMIGLALSIGSPASAQTGQIPHMELVRGLRANGLPDLALEYLDQLKAKNPSPEIVVVLPLEYARTWLDLAADETEDAKRRDLIAKAEERLEVFIKSSKTHPLLPQANVELARLISLKGKGIFLKARKIDKEPKERLDLRNKELARARDTLKKAATQYQNTITILEGQLKQLEKDPPTPLSTQRRKELSQFLMKSMLDQAIVLYDTGETYDEKGTSAEVEQRGNQFNAAKKVFEKLMYLDEKEPICWQARAWAAQCDFQAGEDENAKRAFAEIMAKKAVPAAAAGVRVSRYFGIFRAFDKDARTERQRWERAEKEAGDWLRDYPTYRNTQEGTGARYYYAFMKYTIGRSDLQYDKDGKRAIGFKNLDAKTRLDDAQRLFRDLAETDNEFSEKANRFRSIILVSTADAAGHGDSPPPESLGSFEVCYLMAQVQIARLAQFRNDQVAMTEEPKKEDPKKEPAKKEPAKKDVTPKAADKKDEPKKEPEKMAAPAGANDYAKEEQRRFSNAMRYLEYGLKLATPKDSIREVFNAQLFLVDCYRKLKLYPQAAILGDHLAHNYPKLPRASLAAQIAIQAYNIAHRKVVKEGDEPSPMPTADVNRLRSAADFLVKTWPTEAAADEARHILGFFILREAREKEKEDKSPDRFIEAWKIYADIRDSYPAVYPARNELAGLMFNLVRPRDAENASILTQRIADNIKKYSDPKDPKIGKMWPRTLDLLANLPAPDEDCLLGDAASYLDSRSTLALLYQLENKYDKALLVGNQIIQTLPKFDALKTDDPDLSPQQKENNVKSHVHYINTGRNIVLAAARSKAFKQFNDEKNYAAVAETLNPLIAEMQKDFAKPAPAEITPAFKRLRETQRAILVLALQTAVQDQKVDRAAELVELLDQSGNTVEDNQAMLRSMVANVRGQIDALEKDNKVDDATKLKEGFTTLLDKISAKGDKLPVSMKMFIAQGYTGVDAFEKASGLLEEIRKVSPQKPAPLPKDPTEKQQQDFNDATAAYEASLSIKKQVDYALVRNYRQAKNYDAALKLLTEIIGPVTWKMPILPKDQIKNYWAFSSLQVRKEKAAILEEVAAAAPAKAPANAPKGAPTKATHWGNAVQEWVAIIKVFAPSLPAMPKEIDPEKEKLDPKAVAEVNKKSQSDEAKDRTDATAKFSEMLSKILPLKGDNFQQMVKRIQSEDEKVSGDALNRTTEFMKQFRNVEVTDLADLCLKGEARSIADEDSRKRFEAAIKSINTAVIQNRARRGEEATNAANKRKMFFELFFEQKRCTVMAYTDIGQDSLGGKDEFEAKFRKLAKDFHDLEIALESDVEVIDPKTNKKKKDRQVPESLVPLKERIAKLINDNKFLKPAYKSVLAGN